MGVGLLVGLQRERAGTELAGIRTFPLITVLGCVCGLTATTVGGWSVAAGLLGVAISVAMGNVVAMRRATEREAGITTEVAALLMFVVGVLAAIGPLSVAASVGAGVAILLQAKEHLHGLAAKIGDKDMRAIMLFAAITFVVLPVLPDRAMGPLEVWNPRNIWLMVVLVVGMSLGGYVAYKVFGGRAGTLLSGVLGGMISSTATTVTYARRAHGQTQCAASAVVITLASTVVYARLMTEVAVAAPAFLPVVAWPLGIMMAAAGVSAVSLWLLAGRAADGLPEQENPTQLKPALVFAAIYAAVLLAVAVGKKYFGDSGVYVVAGISGLTDTDAITLSTSRLVSKQELAPGQAWRVILVAVMANIAFKTGIVATLGGRRLLGTIAVLFGIQIAVALGLLVFWP